MEESYILKDDLKMALVLLIRRAKEIKMNNPTFIERLEKVLKDLRQGKEVKIKDN